MRVAPIRINQILPNFYNANVKSKALQKDVFEKSSLSPLAFKGLSKAEQIEVLERAEDIDFEAAGIDFLTHPKTVDLTEQLKEDASDILEEAKDGFRALMQREIKVL